MKKLALLSIGLMAATIVATPVRAQEATQEPAAMGFFYPDTNYLTGGNGARATPRPAYYARRHIEGFRGSLPSDEFGSSYGSAFAHY